MMDAELQDLPDLLRGVDLFRGLSVDAFGALARVATRRDVVPGDTVVEEGTIGEEFYILATGSLNVIGRAFDGTELILSRLERGQVFGEQALAGAKPVQRNASIRAITHGRLYAFPRSALRGLQAASPALSSRLGDLGTRQGAWRGTLFRDAVLTDLGIGADSTVGRYPAGAFVFRQGDRGDRVYLIIGGTAEVRRTEGGRNQVLAELGPGQFFGELAVLNDVPRAASVQATSELEVAWLDAAWIRSAGAANPRLRSIFGALQAMYVLPNRGLITLQGGRLGSEPTLTTTYRLPDGRVVLGTRLTEMHAFTARVVDAPEATETARYRSSGGEQVRAVHLAGDRLVEIEAEGEWDRLGEVFRALLDGESVTGADVASFRAGGDFGLPPAPERASAEIVCRCTGITAGQLSDAIRTGCSTLEEIGRRTTATLICGGCVPTVKEFLGEGEWCPGICEQSQSLSEDVRAFRLRWLRAAPDRSRPGQHVVVQGRIGGQWVERPYTLTAPLAGGGCEIIVKREAGGVMSPWLFDSLEPGAALRLSPPRGTFLHDLEDVGDIVFLAGGIGITPALALARHAGSDARSGAGARRLHIDYSESADERFICRSELEELAEQRPWFTLTLRNTRRRGRLDAGEATALAERFGDASFILCGSDRYVLGVRILLAEVGIAPARVISECFTPVGAAPSLPRSQPA